jgi:DNA polymerase III alpha subunit
MSLVKSPNRFFGLHNHSVFSNFDGLGYPDDHFKFCIENGLDGHAITDHGHLNSYAHAQLWVEEWTKKNKDKHFKYIPGVEAYFHPDLEQWQRDKALAEQSKIDKKTARLLQTKQEKLQSKLIAVTDGSDETESIEMSNSLTIEDEEESKSTKHFNPVNRRHHLVILPKSQKGLQKIFAAVSESYLKGFYRFPRMDSRTLREAGKDGDLVITSACIAGFPAFEVFQQIQQLKFDELNEKLLDDSVLLEKCITSIGNVYDLMTSCVGKGNYYLELQFNKLPAQNLVNRAIIEFARRSGQTKQLVVTCDAHYYNPDVWREREIYKKLGFMNYKGVDPDSIPKSRDELKCELYPKNATQVWDEYLRSKVNTSFYDDDLIRDAIERTHDIAHNVIGETQPDRTSKLPNEKLIPKDTTAFNYLVKLCKEGIVKRGFQNDVRYIDRLKEELGVIKKMKNAEYFITYQKVCELARKRVLLGAGRGSGGGSLINYVLYITDLDPIKWDLPFSRFISVYRQGAPDIDCVNFNHLVIMGDGSYKLAGEIVIGDEVLGGDNKPHKILETWMRGSKHGELALEIFVKSNDGTYGCIDVVPNHKFVLSDENTVKACELKVGDKLMSAYNVEVCEIRTSLKTDQLYVDVTVEGDHRFHVVPFNVDENELVLTNTNSYCNGIIPNTFIACGESNQFCSEWCESMNGYVTYENYI